MSASDSSSPRRRMPPKKIQHFTAAELSDYKQRNERAQRYRDYHRLKINQSQRNFRNMNREEVNRRQREYRLRRKTNESKLNFDRIESQPTSENEHRIEQLDEINQLQGVCSKLKRDSQFAETQNNDEASTNSVRVKIFEESQNFSLESTNRPKPLTMTSIQQCSRENRKTEEKRSKIKPPPKSAAQRTREYRMRLKAKKLLFKNPIPFDSQQLLNDSNSKDGYKNLSLSDTTMLIKMEPDDLNLFPRSAVQLNKEFIQQIEVSNKEAVTCNLQQLHNDSQPANNMDFDHDTSVFIKREPSDLNLFPSSAVQLKEFLQQIEVSTKEAVTCNLQQLHNDSQPVNNIEIDNDTSVFVKMEPLSDPDSKDTYENRSSSRKLLPKSNIEIDSNTPAFVKLEPLSNSYSEDSCKNPSLRHNKPAKSPSQSKLLKYEEKAETHGYTLVASNNIGDIRSTERILKDGRKLFLFFIYISPTQERVNIEQFLFKQLLPYSTTWHDAIEKNDWLAEDDYSKYPLIICGDFNINFVEKDKKDTVLFLRFLNNNFNVKLVNNQMISMTNSTSTDAVFARQLDDISQLIT